MTLSSFPQRAPFLKRETVRQIAVLRVIRSLKGGAQNLNLSLTAEQLVSFGTYFSALREAGVRSGVISARDRERIVSRHFLESLAFGSELAQAGLLSGRVIDVGSGGGLPGLSLRIAWPQIEMTLLEASAKKAAFLEILLADLSLPLCEVAVGRAEDVGRDSRYRETYHLAVARAVAPLRVLLELALPFVEVNGYLAALKGSRAAAEIDAAGPALAELQASVEDVRSLPKSAGVSMSVVVIRKKAATPDRFPRRAGIPAKRPLR